MKLHKVLPCLLLLLPLAMSACSSKPEALEVVISLDHATAPLGAATVLVNYSEAGARPLQRRGEAACGAIVPDMTARFEDDGQGQLRIEASSPQGFSAPVDLAVCRMLPEQADMDPSVIAARLGISIVQASDPSGRPLDDRQLAKSQLRSRRTGAPSRAARRQKPQRLASAAQHGRVKEGRAAGAERGKGAAAASGMMAPGGTPGLAPSKAAPSVAPSTSRPSAAGSAHAQGRGPQKRQERVARPLSNEASRRRAEAPPVENQKESRAHSSGNNSVNDDTDEGASAVRYAVTFGVTSDSGQLGALQFDVVHLGSSGGFVGEAGSVDCVSEIPQAMAVFNDRKNGRLSAALVDVDGFATPTAIATCTFKSREAVNANSFAIIVTDNGPPGSKTAVPSPSLAMGVTDLRVLQ